MSTIISGDNIAYTSSQLVSANGNTIIRDSLTANSADTFPSATTIINSFLGVINTSYNGNAFTITIVNESNFTITQTNSDTSLVFVPQFTSASVLIAPGTSVTFQFIQVSNVPEMEVYVLTKGSVAGPAAAPFGSGTTDNALTRYDGTSGNIIQNSLVILSDTGSLTGILDLTASGTIRANTAIALEETGAGTNIITIQAPATLAASYSLTLPVDDGTSGQILTTNGSGVLSWTNPPSGDALFYQYGPTTSVALTTTPTVVNISNGGVVDATYYTNTAGVVTLSTTGVYEIAYTAQFETLNYLGGPESSFAVDLFQNGTLVTGSTTECWTTDANGDNKRPSASKNIVLSVTAADTLEIRVYRSFGTSTAQTRVNQCSLMIIRLR